MSRYVFKLTLTTCGLLMAAFTASACGQSEDTNAATSQTQTSQTQTSETVTSQTQTSETVTSETQTSEAQEPDIEDGIQRHPDVVGVEAEKDADGSWTFNVTLSSPYDSPSRYADAWRVVGPDGAVYGERILSHDHASEQPFTRSHSDIMIPSDVSEVTVEGRDQQYGWGGQTMLYQIDGD